MFIPGRVPPARAEHPPNWKGSRPPPCETSYDDLDRDTRRACRLLSLHPGPDFTAGAAGALLDTDTGTAEDLACVLAGASLLQKLPRAGGGSMT